MQHFPEDDQSLQNGHFKDNKGESHKTHCKDKNFPKE